MNTEIGPLAPRFSLVVDWHGQRFSGNGGMQAATVMAALIAIGCASAPVVQAQTRSPRSYSKVEIDKKIDEIRRDLIAKIPTPEQIEALLGPVYSKMDVDQKLNQLNAAIPQQTVSRQDLDKALQQTVSRVDLDKALQQTVSSQDLNEAIAGATDSAKAREEAIEDRLPRTPPWVAPLVSLLGVMVSGGLAYYIASKAREQAQTIAAAARAKTEADAVNIRTSAYIREWRSGQGRMYALVSMILLAHKLLPIQTPSTGLPTSATGSTILLTTRSEGDWIRKKWTKVSSRWPRNSGMVWLAEWRMTW